MNTTYSPDLKAHLSFDADNTVRHIRHSQEFWLSEDPIPRQASIAYLYAVAETFKIPAGQLKNLHTQVSFLDPREQGIEYHLSEEKHLFDSTTVGYYQTYMNVPVWRQGLSVTIKQNPNRVVASVNISQDGITGTLPPARERSLGAGTHANGCPDRPEAAGASGTDGTGGTPAGRGGEHAEAAERQILFLQIRSGPTVCGKAGAS